MPTHDARFSILHVSDPHWIHPLAIQYLREEYTVKLAVPGLTEEGRQRIQQDYTRKKFELEDAQRHYREIIDAFDGVDLRGHFRNRKSILVHTGDSVNQYPYHRHVKWHEQFESVKVNLLGKLTGKWKFDRKFAVPGNHDTKRLGPEVSDDERFAEFERIFKGWETPITFSDTLIEDNGVKIAVLPLNSCRRCGVEKTDHGEVYDIIEIDTSIINRWAASYAADTSIMKIALVHHNPLPNHGETGRIAAKEVFVNNGDFNQSLIKSNIKIVLSGHKHIGDEIYTAMPRDAYPDVDERKWAKPMIECGFLSVSAPTLLRYEGTAIVTGFYIIEIDVSPNENIALVNVTRYEFDLAKKRFLARTFPYRIALTRLYETGLSSERQKASINILDKVTRRIYGSASVAPLEKVLRLTSSINAVDELIAAYQERTKIGAENVFGMYSASVMSPESWWAHDLIEAFLDVFIDYTKRRCDLTKASKVSGTLRWAIETAFSNAKSIYESIDQSDDKCRDQVMSLCSKLQTNVMPWLRNEEYLNLTRSFTQIKEPPPIANSEIWDLSFKGTHNFGSATEGAFEIARILLWPLEYFESEYAFKVIKLHEQFNVPLFWLNPKSLIGRLGRPRKSIGTFALLSHLELWSGGVRPSENPFFIINTEAGREPKSADYYIASVNQNESRNYLWNLWSKKNVPLSISRQGDLRLAEISALLGRPDICFAIDVWFARNTQLTPYFRASMFRKLLRCKQWVYSGSLP